MVVLIFLIDLIHSRSAPSTLALSPLHPVSPRITASRPSAHSYPFPAKSPAVQTEAIHRSLGNQRQGPKRHLQADGGGFVLQQLLAISPFTIATIGEKRFVLFRGSLAIFTRIVTIKGKPAMSLHSHVQLQATTFHCHVPRQATNPHCHTQREAISLIATLQDKPCLSIATLNVSPLPRSKASHVSPFHCHVPRQDMSPRFHVPCLSIATFQGK